VLVKEAPVVNKDFLLPSCSSKEGGKNILVLATMDLELEEGLTRTREKKYFELKICKRF
jgi:hypothetical protein